MPPDACSRAQSDDKEHQRTPAEPKVQLRTLE
jgi:hypothetical protein